MLVKKGASRRSAQLIVPAQAIERRIYVIRGLKVMLDSDLAELYQVETKNLNKAVKRNAGRFPADFMFQLSRGESESLRFQSGTSNGSRGGRRYQPFVFSEHGVAMLSSVLHSRRAVHMSILIVRAFVKLREMLALHKDLAARVEKLESMHKQSTSMIGAVVDEIRRLRRQPVAPVKGRIGF
jgi:hypothetical protein